MSEQDILRKALAEAKADLLAERKRRLRAESILDSFSDPGSDWKVLLSIKEYRTQYPRVGEEQ